MDNLWWMWMGVKKLRRPIGTQETRTSVSENRQVGTCRRFCDGVGWGCPSSAANLPVFLLGPLQTVNRAQGDFQNKVLLVSLRKALRLEEQRCPGKADCHRGLQSCQVGRGPHTVPKQGCFGQFPLCLRVCIVLALGHL